MRTLTAISLLAVSCLFLWAGEALADNREDALRILDEWTSLRWGDDNMAWVVHYPEELVDPWIAAEAERRRLRPDQAEAYRKAFTDELRIGDATAIMLSIQAFGPEPIKLAPIAENVALVDAAGNRIKPMVFEKALDNPLMGLVQGFIYFPKQSGKNFRIAIKGLKADGETLFAFNAQEPGGYITTTAAPKPEATPQGKEVIVRIPTTKPEKPPEKPKEPEPEFSLAEAELFQPTHPADAPLGLGEGGEEEVFSLPPVQEPQAPISPAVKLAPKQVLDIYLRAWVAGDSDRMYSLLSTESQGKISKELFDREVLTGGFRSALKSGYKVTWSGETAKVTVARKILLVRTLESKQINFVLEDGTYRVSW